MMKIISILENGNTILDKIKFSLKVVLVYPPLS